MLYCCFADDARQVKPSRPGCGPLVGIGGIIVPGDALKSAEAGIEQLCVAAGFPPNEEFKWSPGRTSWMHANLIKEERAAFFLSVRKLLHSLGAQAIVVAEDTGRAPG